MRVKIGDTWYSDEEMPICIELTLQDKFNIQNGPKGATRYMSAPDGIFDNEQLAFDWLNDKKELSQ